jgi:hypothetical protein
MFLARKFSNLSRSFSTSTLRKKFEYSYAYNQFSPTMEMVGRTIGEQVSLMANERPTDIAMKFCLTQQTFSFLELKQRVDELAQNLLNMGFVKGFFNFFSISSGVYGFVNFGHRPWWYRGHFRKKAGKNLEKKIIVKRNNFEKKEKNLGVGQKNEINYG